MHAAGVVADDGGAGAEGVGEFEKGGFAGEVGDAFGRKAGSDGGGDGGVARDAEKLDAGARVNGEEGGEELAPAFDRPAFFGEIFGAADAADDGRGVCRSGRCGPGERGEVEFALEAEVAEVFFPDGGLVLAGFVEIGGEIPGVREQRAPFAGAQHAEALGRAGEPGLEVAAQGVGEEDMDVGVFLAQVAEELPVAGFARRKGDDAFGEVEAFEQRDEGRLGEEGDGGVGAGLAEGADEREGHHDVAQPVGQTQPVAGAAGERGLAEPGELVGEQVALGLETEAAGGNILVAPAGVKPEPVGAVGRGVAEFVFEPAVGAKKNLGGRSFRSRVEVSAVDGDAKEGGAFVVEEGDAGAAFFGEQAGELAGGADAVEEQSEGAAGTGILVEEQHDHGVAAEHVHGLVIAVLAREQAETPALAGFFHVGFEARNIKGSVNGGDFGNGVFDEGREESVGLQEGEMRGEHHEGLRGFLPFGEEPLQYGIEGNEALEAFFGKARRNEDEEAHLDAVAGGLDGDSAALRGGLVGEGVVQVGKKRAAAAAGDGGDEPAHGAAEGGEERFGQDGQELADGIKYKREHKKRWI